jgi:hypothetical protein
MIFHSFSSSLSIQDELVESSSDSCNILPETVTLGSNPEHYQGSNKTLSINEVEVVEE